MKIFRGYRKALVGSAVCACVILGAPIAAAGRPDPGPGRIGDAAGPVTPTVPGLGNVAKALDAGPAPSDSQSAPARVEGGPGDEADSPDAPDRTPSNSDPAPPAGRPNTAPTPTPKPALTPGATPDVPRPTVPAPAPAPEPRAPSRAELTEQLLQLTNHARAANGCQALRANGRLDRSAQDHSDDMAIRDYFSHTSLDGRTFNRRISDAGYGGNDLGENIAAGFPTADEVHDAWMGSAGHRRKILDCAFREIGIGYSPQGGIWTEDFGG